MHFGSGGRRARLMGGAAFAIAMIMAGAASAEAINIEPQPLTSALNEFGHQTNLSVVFTPDLTSQKSTPGVVNSTNPEAALRQLLAGTNLTFKRSGDAFLIEQEGGSGSGDPQDQSAVGDGADSGTVEALIVTAQKREENIQDVPIAISAFSQKELEAQKIEGGFDLLKAIPNVTFSKNNFTSYNFSIRGVGTKAISATTDPGVAVAFNNTALIQNRLFEQEYFDVERVEVLRGPQGTLYGRNATAGVINVISAKPDMNDFDGWVKGEVGNYETKRLSAMVNVPLAQDKLAIRFAGALTSRDGYDYNEVTKNAVNGRDLWSARVTLGFNPTDNLRANLIWERFEEDDDRSRTGKQLCKRDPGPSIIGSTPVSGVHPEDVGNPISDQLRPALFSQGCLPVNLYDDQAFGTPNGLALPFVFGMLAFGDNLYALGRDPEGRPSTLLQLTDPYGGRMQSRDLRAIASFRDPRYQANADLFELNVDFDITDNLSFTSQTAYDKDEVYSFQDYNRFNTQPIFRDTSTFTSVTDSSQPSIFRGLTPGGIFCDPQLGCSDTLAGFDISQSKAKQFSQEFRLQSDFDGRMNFSAGVNYTKFDALVDYYVFYNLITAYAMTPPFNASGTMGICINSDLFGTGPAVPTSDPNSDCPYIDPNPIESIDGNGHNYFRSKNPYHLKSTAAFGEVYWRAADALKVTAGLRYTDDRKTFIPVPSQILLAPSIIGGGAVSSGYPEKPAIKQHWGEFTGRLGVDWKPDLSFTDSTLLYAFYSRGYKGGGANPPSPGFATLPELLALAESQGTNQFLIDFYLSKPILKLTNVEYGPTFDPEFVNAYELGSKSTLLNGALTVNTGVFFYDYRDYQVSQIRDRTAVNENFDASVWGAELETMFSPTKDLQIVFNVGYLDTKIADGETSIDIMNRTQGDPNYTLVKSWAQLPSSCVVPTDVAEQWLKDQALLTAYYDMCGGVGGILGILGRPIIDPNPAFSDGTGVYDPANYPELNGGAGIKAQLGGNELPNSPHWTTNLGAQYGVNLLDGSWRATVRADAYWQSQSWARVYNLDPYDKLHGWYNVNLSLWIERPEDDLKIEFYAKNILDQTPITDAFLNSDDSALTTNVFALDPRLIGLSIRKGF